MNKEGLVPIARRICPDLCRRQGWPTAFGLDCMDVPSDVEADNVVAAARIPRVLALAVPTVVGEDPPSTLPAATALGIIEASHELLAEAEHDGWRAYKHRDGWSHGPVRDDAARRHPCLVQYDALSEEDKEKDRNSVRHYPDIVELAGCRIVWPLAR